MKVIDYIVVAGRGDTEFSVRTAIMREVQKHLALFWEPFGGVSVIREALELHAFQAMVKYERPKIVKKL